LSFTLRQLRYFLVLAEELHFGRAAKRLNISQPPLSASLKQLEDEVGVRLLERNSKSVRLTPAGADFASKASSALITLEKAQDSALQIAEEVSRTLRIGFGSSMIYRGLIEFMSQFSEAHPQINLELHELNSAQQISALQSNDIDVGFIHRAPLPEGVRSKTMVDESFVGCVSRNHRFASRKLISIEELAGEAIIIFSRDNAAYYHDHIVELLRAAKVEPRLTHQVRHWLTVLALVANDQGVSLVPKSLSTSDFPNVSFIDIREQDVRHEATYIWLDDPDDISLRLFLNSAQAHFNF